MEEENGAYNLCSALEALLFVTNEPVSTAALADALQLNVQRVSEALHVLQRKLEREESGIVLSEIAGGWQLFTHPAYHDLVEQYVLSWDARKLSQAAIETLAIIAYIQPATRAQVAAVRGVNSDSSINSLLDKGLLREAGVAETPGNPVLYATSQQFLERFGLQSTRDLPPLEDFAPDEQARALIAERLGIVGGEAMGEGPSAMAEDISAMAEEPHVAAAGVIQDEEDEMASSLAQAAMSALGITERVDFDALVFDTDDE